MINDNKRVLEHFNNLSKRKENEKVEVSRQNIKYLVNKLEKYFTQTEQLQELTDEIYQHLEDKESLEQQIKRYREAIDYVLKTEPGHYSNMYELLEDVKFVINETLGSDSDE